MKTHENKNLQGRREFFKQATRRTLPIIGAVALMSSPMIAQTLNNDSAECNCQGCTGGCGGCTGCNGCSNTSSATCSANSKTCYND